MRGLKMKQNKLNYCLFSLLVFFGIGAAQGVTLTCGPAKMNGYTKNNNGTYPLGLFTIYFKLTYTDGKASQTTKLEILRKGSSSGIPDQSIKTFDTTSANVQVQNAGPTSIRSIQIAPDNSDYIVMNKIQGDNEWRVDTRLSFPSDVSSNPVEITYIGIMRCI
jgi:hypothetical protein